MSPLEAIHAAGPVPPPASADDAYSAWFNAQQRCGEALRAWREARGRSTRATAYFAYRFALEREEAAANELSRVSTLALAA
jgi:hypothetical protein